MPKSGSMDIMLWVENTEEELGIFGKRCIRGGRKRLRIPSPSSTIMCSTFSVNTNQEADHVANLGAEGQRKITVEKGNNTENLKAVRGFRDDSKKTDGQSGSGVVSKRLDRDKWSRCGRCRCSDWNLGLGVGKNHQ